MSARWGLRPVLRVLTLNKHRRRSQQQSSCNCNVEAWKKPQQQLQQYYKQHSHSHTRAITYNARTDTHSYIELHWVTMLALKTCVSKTATTTANADTTTTTTAAKVGKKKNNNNSKNRAGNVKNQKRDTVFFCFCLKRTSAAAQWRIVIE